MNIFHKLLQEHSCPIEGIMRSFVFKDILETNMPLYAEPAADIYTIVELKIVSVVVWLQKDSSHRKKTHIQPTEFITHHWNRWNCKEREAGQLGVQYVLFDILCMLCMLSYKYFTVIFRNIPFYTLVITGMQIIFSSDLTNETRLNYLMYFIFA